MKITTAQDVLLVDCCSCSIPLCESPRKQCESKTAISTSADDDYTDSVEEWERKEALWNDYQDWLDADPETRGPEPEHEGNPGPEPVAPVDYNDVDHGSWGPFIKPDGEPTDDIPTLYRTNDYVNTSWFDGEASVYTASDLNDGRSVEAIAEDTYTNGVFARGTRIMNFIDAEGDCTSEDNIFGVTSNPPASEQTEVFNEKPCLPDSYIRTRKMDSDSGNTKPQLIGCPGPFTDDDVDYWDFTETLKEGIQLGDGVGKAEVIARATGKIRPTWPETPEGTNCSSEIDVDWPLIGDIDPWPSCEDGPPLSTGTVTVTKSRYRMGIPSGDRWEATTAEWLAWEEGGSVGEEPLKTTFDVAHAAWVIAKAEWDAADPETRGEEPLEPTTRSTYELKWDEVFFSEEWEEWNILKNAFDAATKAHAAWVAAGSEGEEPVIPEEPAEEPTPPSLIASRTWVYSELEWSSWFEIPIPEVEGETRVVNVMITCYKSASLGQKPTSYEERFKF